MNNDYVIKDDLEMYIFISITDKTLRISQKSSFKTYSEWANYTSSFLLGNASMDIVEKTISKISKNLSDIYALSDNEIAKYIIKFFKYELWIKFLPLVRARQSYFG